jgi:DNA-binding transcriptional MerR regulator
MPYGQLQLGKTLFRIREAADILGVEPHVLRFWEMEFPWLCPERDEAGRRRYTRRNLEDLLVVKKMLHEDKFTIAGARKVLTQARLGGRLEDLRQPQRETLRRHDDRTMLLSLKKELQSLLDMLK